MLSLVCLHSKQNLFLNIFLIHRNILRKDLFSIAKIRLTKHDFAKNGDNHWPELTKENINIVCTTNKQLQSASFKVKSVPDDVYFMVLIAFAELWVTGYYAAWRIGCNVFEILCVLSGIILLKKLGGLNMIITKRRHLR